MKVLIVLTTDSLGGAEQYLKMIAYQYKGEDIDIYYFKNNRRGQWDDVESFANKHLISKVHEITGILGFIWSMLFKRKRYDYIYTSHIYTNALVGLLKSIGVIKSNYFVARESTSIFLRFNGFKLKFYAFLYRLGYRKMDLLICQTDLMKEQFVDHFPKIERRSQIQVIPNPIDLSGKSELANEAVNEEFEKDCIISAGRLIKLKGYHLLIQAFERLKIDHPNLKLVIFGRGPWKEIIEDQVSQSQYKNDILMPGRVNNVYKYFKRAKVCVVSSLIEGFPNVLLQMMSQNEKVVSTRCAGGIESIKGLHTCEPGNIDALHKTIETCINSDTSLNRVFFDDYLDSRSIESFMKKVNTYLSEE